MKNGKVILGAASFIITVVGAFAFKGAHSNHRSKKLVGTINGNGVCQTTNCWKTASNVQASSCRTAGTKAVTTLYTTKSTAGTCQNVTTHSTLTV